MQDDLQGLLLGDSSHPDLITLLEGLTNILYQGYSGWNYPYQWPADLLLCVGDLIANQLILVQNCWYLAPELGDNTPQEQLEEHCANMAQQGNYTVQVVTTQRQVVVVISSGSVVLGIYYDAVLAQYTGFGVNF